MRLTRASKQKKIKRLLLCFVLFTVGIVFATYYIYRQSPETEATAVTLTDENVNVAIGRVHQTATKDGVTEWRLDAESVKYMESQKKALFQDVVVTFFLEDGQEIILKANEGILRIDSKDIEVSGNVVVENSGYRLETTRLRYSHEKRLISTKVPVHITGKAGEMEADSFLVDLNKNRAEFNGHVKGTFDENATL